MDRYQYGPAIREDQIRLLRIEPSASDTISVTLQTVAREGAQYTALSYTWGSPVLDKTILCNDTTLYITSNLHDLLYALREDNDDTWLWIDGICINQSDSDDKSTQVRVMSVVYRQADYVIIWLGKEGRSTKAGLGFLSLLCKVIPSSNGDDIRSIYIDPSLPILRKLEDLGIPEQASLEWVGVNEILRAPWFGRRWILQEVTSSRRCIFRIGREHATPETILGGFYRISNVRELRYLLDETSYLNCARVETIVQLLRAQQASWLHESLADILLETCAFESSDARDRIFAVLGCLRNFPGYIVDYSLTLPEVLVQVAFCERDEDEFKLSLLRGMCYVDRLQDDVPSWIPTWEFDVSRSLWDISEQDCTDVSQMEIVLSEDKRSLWTGAIVFDKIVEQTPALAVQDELMYGHKDHKAQKDIILETYTERCEWLLNAERMTKTALGSSDCLEEFLSCYFFGADSHWDEDFDVALAYESYLRLCAVIYAKSKAKDARKIGTAYREKCVRWGLDEKQPESDEEIATSYEESILEVADSWHVAEEQERFGRRFFRTQKGKIGWSPQGAREGDFLCVAFGFATPMAIRKVRTGRAIEADEYRMIGACYVHGCMDGEIFQDDSLPRTKIKLV